MLLTSLLLNTLPGDILRLDQLADKALKTPLWPVQVIQQKKIIPIRTHYLYTMYV